MRVPRNHRFALMFFAAALPATFTASQPSAADSNATVRVAAIQVIFAHLPTRRKQ